MRRSLAAIVFAAAFLCGGPAAAQDAQPPAQPEPAKQYDQETLDLAAQLVKLSGTARGFDQLLPNIADSAKNAFIRANPQMQLGIIEVVDRIALTLVARRPELDRQLALAWAAAFSKDEMHELIAFYKTETGKKFAAIQPRLMTVEMAAAQGWSRSVEDELTQKVRDELRAAMSAEQQSLQGGASPAPAQ
jgi:hypothetical protein